jgi:hypothetical protein
MTTTDVVFKDLTEEELAKVPSNSYAHFGWEGKGAFAFMTTALAYYESAETIYQKMRCAGNDFAVLDGHIYALIFLYRHFIELFLKGLYMKYSGETEANIKGYLNAVGHDLNASWNKVKPILSQGKKHVGSSQNLGVIEHYINAVNSFDPTSMVMRYPLDKRSMNQMHQNPMHLDYINLHDRMTELYDSLRTLDYDIENQLNVTASDEEIADFMSHYQQQMPLLDKYLALVQKEAEKEKSTDLQTVSLHERCLVKLRSNQDKAIRRMNGNKVDGDYLLMYSNSVDDFKIIVEVLFYAGRDVKEHSVTLSQSNAEKQREFVQLCLDRMHLKQLQFGTSVKDEQLKVLSTCAGTIFDNISIAKQLLQ